MSANHDGIRKILVVGCGYLLRFSLLYFKENLDSLHSCSNLYVLSVWMVLIIVEMGSRTFLYTIQRSRFDIFYVHYPSEAAALES